MTTTASVNFRAEFAPVAKQAYQQSSKLMGKVRTRPDVNGKTYSFPVIGKGIAQLRLPQTDVIPMNIAHTAKVATLVDYVAPDYSAHEDLDKLSFDERKEIMYSVAHAIGRQIDQVIIDAMAASAFATQVAKSVGGADTSLNIEKIMQAKRLLDDNGVPDGDRCMVITARALEAALLETEIASSDFNVVKALATGDLKKFAGFEFVMIESRAEGGLPISSTTRNCFAFHKEAVGLAMTGGIKTEVNYVPEKLSTLITACVSAGAVTIDTDGVIDVLVHEA
jgi:hypothetical protein